MVMQRIANPPIPVRFWVSPPNTRPGGEIGRHNGLKIRRNRKKCVPVRFRFRAPSTRVSGRSATDFFTARFADCSQSVTHIDRLQFCCCLMSSLVWIDLICERTRIFTCALLKFAAYIMPVGGRFLAEQRLQWHPDDRGGKLDNSFHHARRADADVEIIEGAA